MSTGLKVGLGIAALVVLYELYSKSSSAASIGATVAPVAIASPLAPAPGSVAPVVTASVAPSLASSASSHAYGYATKAVDVAATSSLAIVTGGLSTATGRAIYEGIGKGIANGASDVYHGIASIF